MKFCFVLFYVETFLEIFQKLFIFSWKTQIADGFRRTKEMKSAINQDWNFFFQKSSNCNADKGQILFSNVFFTLLTVNTCVYFFLIVSTYISTSARSGEVWLIIISLAVYIFPRFKINWKILQRLIKYFQYKKS